MEVSCRLLELTLLLLTFTANLKASTENFDFDNIPGVAYEFKVHVDAGKEDCFYQFVQQNATLYVSFQVIRGGDGMAGFAVRHPNGMHVHPYQWKDESEYTELSNTGGFYEVCVDNQFSRFASKLVNVYITTYRHDEWDSYLKELEELEISVANFTGAITSVTDHVNNMLRYQQFNRRHEARDYSLLLANNSYVQMWSLAQCAIIFLTTSLQVYFVRKLFDVQNVTPTCKPRA